eukprot:ANDGO_07534.mRNA.1 hypothetical protein
MSQESISSLLATADDMIASQPLSQTIVGMEMTMHSNSNSQLALSSISNPVHSSLAASATNSNNSQPCASAFSTVRRPVPRPGVGTSVAAIPSTLSQLASSNKSNSSTVSASAALLTRKRVYSDVAYDDSMENKENAIIRRSPDMKEEEIADNALTMLSHEAMKSRKPSPKSKLQTDPNPMSVTPKPVAMDPRSPHAFQPSRISGRTPTDELSSVLRLTTDGTSTSSLFRNSSEIAPIKKSGLKGADFEKLNKNLAMKPVVEEAPIEEVKLEAPSTALSAGPAFQAFVPDAQRVRREKDLAKVAKVTILPPGKRSKRDPVEPITTYFF